MNNGAAQARWTNLQKRAFQAKQVPAEVTSANNLEGLIGRVTATIPDSLSRIPGTSEMLAGGVQYTDGNEATNSVLLQYS